MPDFLPERARRFIQAPILQTAPVFTADEPLLAAAGLHLRRMKKASLGRRLPFRDAVRPALVLLQKKKFHGTCCF